MTPATGSLGETPPAAGDPSERLVRARQAEARMAVENELRRFIGQPVERLREEEVLAAVRSGLESLAGTYLESIDVGDLFLSGDGTVHGTLKVRTFPVHTPGQVCTCSYDESEEMTRHAPLCQVCLTRSEFP